MIEIVSLQYRICGGVNYSTRSWCYKCETRCHDGSSHSRYTFFVWPSKFL